jgi:hypothetical protein
VSALPSFTSASRLGIPISPVLSSQAAPLSTSMSSSSRLGLGAAADASGSGSVPSLRNTLARDLSAESIFSDASSVSSGALSAVSVSDLLHAYTQAQRAEVEVSDIIH